MEGMVFKEPMVSIRYYFAKILLAMHSISLRGIKADINFNIEDYEDDYEYGFNTLGFVTHAHCHFMPSFMFKMWSICKWFGLPLIKIYCY